MSTRVDKNNVQKFLKHTSESVRDRARVNSGSSKLRSMVNVFPFPSLGLHLKAAEFVARVKYRLGLQIFPYEGMCVACPAVSETYGDHAVSCG